MKDITIKTSAIVLIALTLWTCTLSRQVPCGNYSGRRSCLELIFSGDSCFIYRGFKKYGGDLVAACRFEHSAKNIFEFLQSETQRDLSVSYLNGMEVTSENRNDTDSTVTISVRVNDDFPVPFCLYANLFIGRGAESLLMPYSLSENGIAELKYPRNEEEVSLMVVPVPACNNLSLESTLSVVYYSTGFPVEINNASHISIYLPSVNHENYFRGYVGGQFFQFKKDRIIWNADTFFRYDPTINYPS